MTPPLAQQLAEHSSWLLRLAEHLVRDPHAARDVVQDTMVRALEQAKGVKQPRPFLARVLGNIVRDRFRREGKRPEVERRAARYDRESTTLEVVVRQSLRDAIARAIDALPPTYREVLVLRFFDDLPPREVAVRLGIPVETVRTRVRRALVRVRESLDRDRGGRAAWAAPLIAAIDRTTVRAGFGAWSVATAAACFVGATLSVWWWTAAEVSVTHEVAIAEPSIEASATEPGPSATARADRVSVDVQQPVVTGRVVDEASGTPIAGAAVAWRRGDDLALGLPGSDAVTTDSQGEFALPAGDASGRDWDLVVGHDDFASVRRSVGFRPSRDLRVEPISLAPGTRVVGSVHDADGFAIDDASIWGLFEHELAFGWPLELRFELRPLVERAVELGRTNRHGEFRARERLTPHSADDVFLAIGGGSVGWVEVELMRARGERNVAIEMLPTTSLAVACRGADGSRVVGASVWLEPKFAPLRIEDRPSTDRFGALTPLRDLLSRTTDVSGTANFASVPVARGGSYALRVEAAGRMPLRIADLDLQAGLAESLELELADLTMRKLDGIVRDAGGTPVAGAAVAVRLGNTRAVRTDQFGRFSIDDLEPSPDQGVAIATCDGYGPSGLQWFGDHDSSLELTLGNLAAKQPRPSAPESEGHASVSVALRTHLGESLDARRAVLFERDSKRSRFVELKIGRATATDLFPGRWVLEVEPHDGPTIRREFEVLVDGAALELTCIAPAPVEVERVERGGEPSVDEPTPSLGR